MPNAIRVPSLRLTELDGSPDIQGVERIYLTNGFMSSLGNGAALLSLSGSASSLTVRDIDGSPNVSNVTTIYTTNGFLSNLGNGSVLLSLSGSGSGNVATDAIWVSKGDLAGGTGTSTAARLAVSTNGYCLVGDSTQTTGLAWATYPSAHGCRIKRTSGDITAASGGTGTPIPFTAEDFDTNGYHDNVTDNTKITIPAGLGGTYMIGAGFYAQVNCDLNILVNNTTGIAFGRQGAGDASLVGYVVATTYVLAAGDFIELIATGRGGTKTVFFDAANASPHFWAYLIGK